MGEHRRNHGLFLTFLSLALALAVLLTGSSRQLANASQTDHWNPPSSTPYAVAVRRPPVKITGWLYEADATHLRIGDQFLHIHPSFPVAMPGVQVGMYVAAVAKVGEDGQWYAQSVSVLPAVGRSAADSSPLPQDRVSLSPGGVSTYPIEFRGLIQEIDPRYWVVGSRLVFITDRTLVQGRPDIGVLAEVKGTLVIGEIVVARSIRVIVPDAYAEVEFEGVIESLSADVWTVSGVVVTISPVTAIEGTPAFGQAAEVRGVLQPDGTVLAQWIMVRAPGFAAHIDFAGRVEGIAVTHWIIAGKTVLIDQNTFIDDSRAAAEVGMWVQVRALSRRDGSLLALRIRLSRPN